MKETNKWNPKEYNKHTRFVSELALPVVDLLAPECGEKILDVGCGDGTLAVEMQKRGAKVIGIDTSSEMVASCKEKEIEAHLFSVTDLPYKESFDAVFSNATLHWVKDARSAIDNIASSLKSGGRFVAEFGGEGNVDALVSAMEELFDRHDDFGEFNNPWYFPSIKSYKKLLEDEGFEVEYIALIPRPTPMNDIKNWLDIFTNGVTEGLSQEQREVFISECKERVRPRLYHDRDGWMLDYVRLRVKAIKR